MSSCIVRVSICWGRVCESGVNHVLIIGCLMKYIPFRTSKRTVAIPRKIQIGDVGVDYCAIVRARGK